jgi:prevent-host-death family protein
LERRRDFGLYDVLRRERFFAEKLKKAARSQDGGYIMKTVNARDLQKRIKECVDISQEDQVVITRRGKPAAVMVGVEGKDWEDVVIQTSSTFWKFIEQRRKEPTLSMKELRTRLKKRKK